MCILVHAHKVHPLIMHLSALTSALCDVSAVPPALWSISPESWATSSAVGVGEPALREMVHLYSRNPCDRP